MTSNNVVPLHHGIELHDPSKATQSKRRPQVLKLPPLPSEADIRWERKMAGLSKQQAADLCNVSISTWRRWERGADSIPRTAWAWFRTVISGAYLAGGPDWEGWSFWKGNLCTPEGWEFRQGEVRAIPLMHQRIAVLEAEVRKLRSDLELSNAIAERTSRDYHAAKAFGQLEALSRGMVSILNALSKGEDGMPPVLPDLHEVMKSALLPIYNAQMQVLQLGPGLPAPTSPSAG